MTADDLLEGADGQLRCRWAKTPEYERYHDEEWGQPTFDEHVLFEKLCLEGFQAGLSWITVLMKRPRFREVFFDFDPAKVAAMNDEDVERLLQDAGIIRHEGKIRAAIGNAQQVMRLRAEGSSLTALLWSFAPNLDDDGPQRMADIPAVVDASTQLSKALKKRGFRFVGPTTMYALMQAMGMVNDHLPGCHVRDCVQKRQQEARKIHLNPDG